MKQIRHLIFAAGLALAFNAMASPVQANVFQRIMDIYQTPERLQEFQEQYNETRERLESRIQSQQEALQAQAVQLETSRRQVEELLTRQQLLEHENESLRQQNEQLLAENQELINRLEKAQQLRDSAIRTAVVTVGGFLVLLALYSVAVRIWRLAVVRRQSKEGKEALYP
mgnify:CR=1 FL=1